MATIMATLHVHSDRIDMELAKVSSAFWNRYR